MPDPQPRLQPLRRRSLHTPSSAAPCSTFRRSSLQRSTVPRLGLCLPHSSRLSVSSLPPGSKLSTASRLRLSPFPQSSLSQVADSRGGTITDLTFHLTAQLRHQVGHLDSIVSQFVMCDTTVHRFAMCETNYGHCILRSLSRSAPPPSCDLNSLMPSSIYRSSNLDAHLP